MQVVKQLLGEEPLPWERMTVATRKTLGAFKGPIMQLLNRDPSQRPSMAQFYDNCNAIFSTSTTYTPAAKGSMGSHTSDLMHVESGTTSSANNTEAATATEGATSVSAATATEGASASASASASGTNTSNRESGGVSPWTPSTAPSGSASSGTPGTAAAGVLPNVTEGATINGSTEMPRLATQTIQE